MRESSCRGSVRKRFGRLSGRSIYRGGTRPYFWPSAIIAWPRAANATRIPIHGAMWECMHAWCNIGRVCVWPRPRASGATTRASTSAYDKVTLDDYDDDDDGGDFLDIRPSSSSPGRTSRQSRPSTEPDDGGRLSPTAMAVLAASAEALDNTGDLWTLKRVQTGTAGALRLGVWSWRRLRQAVVRFAFVVPAEDSSYAAEQAARAPDEGVTRLALVRQFLTASLKVGLAMLVLGIVVNVVGIALSLAVDVGVGRL